MKKLLLIYYLLTLTMFSACAQNRANSFIGRIYILESQETFFQITSKDSASYYTINEFGEQKVKQHTATWHMPNDSTMILTVAYQPKHESAEFLLHYNEQKDYWIDDDYISAYRRMKRVKFKEFDLKEY